MDQQMLLLNMWWICRKRFSD